MSQSSSESAGQETGVRSGNVQQLLTFVLSNEVL
jgi:hypothetical protein